MHIPPFDLRIDSLRPGGLGCGRFGDHEVVVRGAPPGSVVRVAPFRRKAGVLHGRRLRLVEAPAGAVPPRCAAFGLCGGCVLQELPADVQRAHREAMVHRLLEPLEGVEVHPVLAASPPYGYRAKIELTFGTSRYLSSEDLAAGLPIGGRFLGFHPPGRFDRIVDLERCELVSESLNRVLARVRLHLRGSGLPPWNPRTGQGFWRHLVLRETATGERLVTLYTAPPVPGADREMRRLAAALPEVSGVVWQVNERRADAAAGSCHAVLRGRPWVEELAAGRRFRLSPTSFFQVSGAGAAALYGVVAEAAGHGRRLLDLYCGAGVAGIVLAERFEEVVGVERNPEAIADARVNAALNGLDSLRFVAGAVEDMQALPEADVLIVDPPRAGLHPRVARRLAGLGSARRLVYVACDPRSLARDRRVLEGGGWAMDALWTVDLFPQTGHIEAVARFGPVRAPAG